MEPVMTDGSTGAPPTQPPWSDRGCGVAGAGASSRLWIGLLLIGLGTLFALATYAAVDFHVLRLFWPLFLLVLGTGLLVRSRGRRAGGLIVLLAGAWLLARDLGVLPLDERLFPATVLVVVGLSLAVSSLVSRRRLPRSPQSPQSPG